MSHSRIFFGWRVVGTALTDAVFAWGIGFQGPPIFLEVLHTSRGWPVTLVSAAITAHFLAGAFVVSWLATLHRRHGLVAVTRLGAALTALGLLGWALAPEAWLLFLAAPISGAGWALTGGAALNAMVSPWFVRRRAAVGTGCEGCRPPALPARRLPESGSVPCNGYIQPMAVVAAIILFLLPAAAYLAWRRYGPDGGEPSSPMLIALLLAAGLILAGGAWYGLSGSLKPGETYVPARLGPDGRVIPGGATR